jgi:hypothetical protein
MTKLDLTKPVAGLYRMTRTVHHEKPDGRAARGWDSREGTPEDTLVRVTLHSRRIDMPEINRSDISAETRAKLEAKAKELRVWLALPGRYFRPTDVALDAFDHDDEDRAAQASKRTLAAIVDALELYEGGDGVLAMIRPAAYYSWDGLLAFMVETGRLTKEQLTEACDAFDATETEGQ